MNWLEIIHLRAYSKKERDEAVVAFENLMQPELDVLQEKIVLFQNCQIGNDLSIYIFRQSLTAGSQKSPLGLRLASAFSEFGQINHSVWTPVTSRIQSS